MQVSAHKMGYNKHNGLATCIVQTPSTNDAQEKFRMNIPRMKSFELKSFQPKDVNLEIYKGPKNPGMPDEFCKYQVMPLKFLSQQVVICQVSMEKDFSFFKDILTQTDIPDINGYNTKIARTSGESTKPKTNILYLPLLDQTPSDPSTMLTTIKEAERVTNEAEQEITIFTADQQLCKVALDIPWADQPRFLNFMTRIGGMHWLMSFIGCVGVLMGNIGLNEILKSAERKENKQILKFITLK